MCHTVIAQRICQVCQRSQGETVIDFTKCARKCSSPFYCLTPKPQMEVCALCAPTTLSTPVMSQHGSIDSDADSSTSTTAARTPPSRPIYEYPFTQAVTVRPSDVGHHAA